MNERVDDLRSLEAQLAAYRATGLELSGLLSGHAKAMAQSLKQMPSTSSKDKVSELLDEWKSLDARYAETVDQFDKHVQRAKKGGGPSMTPLGLIAPDSIRIVDEPRDPESPTTSLLKILVACLAAGVGMGAGLAALSEQLDNRIHDHRSLAGLTGTDAVFRVPLIPTDNETAESVGGTTRGDAPPRPSRLAVVSRA